MYGRSAIQGKRHFKWYENRIESIFETTIKQMWVFEKRSKLFGAYSNRRCAVKPNPEKIQTLRESPTPKTQK